jgi:hypothetical protein
MTTVACDFDFHETKRVSHYTYAIARVILNTSVQIVITLYSNEDSRWGKNIIIVLQGEDYAKWTDDSYITEVVEKKIASLMPPPPTPVVVEEIKEEVVEEPKVVAEEVVEEAKETHREEIVEEIKKVACKKAVSRKKKEIPNCPILVSPTH